MSVNKGFFQRANAALVWQPRSDSARLKPVSDRNYPIWPPGSPQHPGDIPRHDVKVVIEDLPYNQVPHNNGANILLRQRIIPKTQPLEGPGTNTNLEVGHYGSTLYDAFMAPYNPKKTGG